MSLYPDVTVKSMPPNTDLTSRCVPIQAHDLKQGHWCLDTDKTGIAGTVSELKMSKTGKHGHAKFTYKLRMPHSGRANSCMHPGGDQLVRPVMEKKEYQLIYIDEMEQDKDVYDVVCMDENNEEMTLKIAKERTKEYTTLFENVERTNDEAGDVFLTVLEGPRKNKDNTIDILQIITDSKFVPAE
jgi:translation elongation factor P/translation initiation factor 5A